MSEKFEKYVGRHVFANNDNAPGEQLQIVTDFIDNGDGMPDGLCMSHQLVLQASFNSAAIHLQSIEITPSKLRELANELESKIAKLQAK